MNNEKNEMMCFDTIDGATLMSTPLQPLRFVVDSLISQGLHVLAGSPKVGKSWLALWLSVTVAKGEPVWGMQTRQGTTLYLCLEDSRLRIQNRLFEIMEDAPPSVHFCTEGFIIGGGLRNGSKPSSTCILIRSLLSSIRCRWSEVQATTIPTPTTTVTYLFSKSWRTSTVLLSCSFIIFARKADDVFNRISRYRRAGAVDSSFTLIEDKRGSGKAKLSCIGRDIEYREIVLERNEDNVWEMVSDSREQPELLGYAIISLLSAFMKSCAHFIGTPTELTDTLCSLSGKDIAEENIPAHHSKRDAFMDAGITFDIRRSNGKRLIELHRADVTTVPIKMGLTQIPQISSLSTLYAGA